MDHAAIAAVKAALQKDDVPDVPLPDVRRLLRKSALLNLGVIVSAVMIAAPMGQRRATAVAVLALMTSSLIWVATFLTALLVLIVTNFRRIGGLLSHRPGRSIGPSNPLADDWLDGPGMRG